MLGAPLVVPLTAQEMKIPGEASVEAHVVKPAPLPATDDRIRALKLPAGFTLTKYAEGLGKPRVMVLAPDGALYVSDRDAGTIQRLPPPGKDGKPTGPAKIVLKKNDVHGLALRDGTLWYITICELFSAPIKPDGTIGPEKKLLGDLPDAGQHPNRTIGFGPDGWLYVSVGSTCNECDERNPENATMLRLKPDGSGKEVFATGLRNTIGFDWHPQTKALYGWDDGVDWLGDDAQREELNLIERGQKYGWPLIFADGQKNYYREPAKGTLDDWDRESRRPVGTYTAHSSGMQLVFYSGSQFPAEYRGDAFVTLHGSWNRRPPSGYEIVRVHFENGQFKAIEPWLTGFLVEDQGKPARWARPFGLVVAKDGSLLMGEDQNGIIYRIAHEAAKR